MKNERFLPKTERINVCTQDIDAWPVRKMLEIMNREDRRIVPAIAQEIPQIERAVGLVVNSLSKGGRLFYAGAGTSGRLGILDRAELRPTFGLPDDQAIALMCGGEQAVFSAFEHAEDKEEEGKAALMVHEPNSDDVIIGITASGGTPFVLGAVKAASSLGLSLIAVLGDPRGSIGKYAQVVIAPDVGPEVIGGSTRLKNATAHKMVLNMITTASLIALGRTYSNLMAGISPTSQKLSSRARRILVEATGRELVSVEDALNRAKGDVGAALIMLKAGFDAESASAALKASSNSIRLALKAAAETGRTTLPPDPTPSAPQTLYFGTPEEAGFDPKKLENAFQVVGKCVGHGEGPVPGAVALVARNNVVLGPMAWGWASRLPHRLAAGPDTLFDMASLTKVIATTPSILILCEEGEMRLDDSVARFIPEFGVKNKSSITIKQLLTHTSGLPSHMEFWKESLKGEGIIHRICSLEIHQKRLQGNEVVYSDLGFILLGEIIERVTGLSVKGFAEKRIFGPLGMSETFYLPKESLKPKIAATEFREDLNHVVWGKVHDENAHALGGIAGHAGLFSTAVDTAKYALMWLNEGRLGKVRILARTTVSEATKEQVGGKERRALGWMLKSKAFSSAGDFLSESAFGHTGFTGTSLWCDPRENLAIVLLTNRVHAGRESTAHIRLRPVFANAVIAAIAD